MLRPWCWERLKVGGEGDNKGWDGGMASPSQWTWVWVSSGSWWWTGRPVSWSPWSRKESDTTQRLNWTDEERGGVLQRRAEVHLWQKGEGEGLSTWCISFNYKIYIGWDAALFKTWFESWFYHLVTGILAWASLFRRDIQPLEIKASYVVISKVFFSS